MKLPYGGFRLIGRRLVTGDEFRFSQLVSLHNQRGRLSVASLAADPLAGEAIGVSETAGVSEAAPATAGSDDDGGDADSDPEPRRRRVPLRSTTTSRKADSGRAAQRRKANPPRLPDPSPWPLTGYVSVEMLMHGMGGASVSTIYSYKRIGLLPEPDRIGLNKVGWRVEVARQALADLPAKVAALRASKSNISTTAR